VKKFSSILVDILIILFIGFCGGLVDIMFSFYKDEMVETLLMGILIGVFIGISIMLANLFLYKFKKSIPFYQVSVILIMINAIGIFFASYITHNTNIQKVIMIFLMTSIVSNFIIYNNRKLERQLNFYLSKKKQELQIPHNNKKR